mmetsp:Transcript_263/g.612  ORF Transcript_263/g.612 Transcript_263/m.612 type:complete len:327 (-) Transcript_263:412-1392(-)
MDSSMITAETMYRSHSRARNALDALARTTGPPSSAPSTRRRTSRRPRHRRAQTQKTATIGPSEPASTSNSPSLISQYMEATDHDNPSPRKTLTELLPVTLPMLLSAMGSWMAAVLEANVSGSDVPSATKVMAQIEGGMPRAQPSRLARSPRRAVQRPIMSREQPKQTLPPQNSVGGTTAKSTFQGTLMTWKAQSVNPASACDSASPPTYRASANWSWSTPGSFHLALPISMLSKFTIPRVAKMLTIALYRVSPLWSLSIVIVQMPWSAPPSVVSSKETIFLSPSHGSMMRRKLSSLMSIVFTGRIVTSIIACATPSGNSSSPDTSS